MHLSTNGISWLTLSLLVAKTSFLSAVRNNGLYATVLVVGQALGLCADYQLNQAHHQYKQGLAVQIRQVISTSRVDDQFWYGRGGEGTIQKYFPMNESLLLLIHQVKKDNCPWQVTEIN